MFPRKIWQSMSMLTLIAFGVMLCSSAVEAQGPEDFALRHPLFAGAAKKYGKDWEKNVHPRVQILLNLQRVLRDHALVVGFSDEEPNPKYTKNILILKVIITVTKWDKTDLFSLGIPKKYANGKPVEIVEFKDFPQLADEIVPLDLASRFFGPVAKPFADVYGCTYERPAKGGLRVRNKRLNGAGTLGGAVIGFGWPTNSGWKYMISNAHVLADANGNFPDDQIDQPGAQCGQNAKLGNLGGIWQQGIPDHLKVKTNNVNNPTIQMQQWRI